MEDLVTVYQFKKWDGANIVIGGWATEEAIKIFEAIKIPEQRKQVKRSQLDGNDKLRNE